MPYGPDLEVPGLLSRGLIHEMRRLEGEGFATANFGEDRKPTSGITIASGLDGSFSSEPSQCRGSCLGHPLRACKPSVVNNPQAAALLLRKAV